MIFSRPIKDCPLFIEVTEHNPPLISFGARGAKEKGFMQPCNVTVDARNNVFVVDTVLLIFPLVLTGESKSGCHRGVNVSFK